MWKGSNVYSQICVISKVINFIFTCFFINPYLCVTYTLLVISITYRVHKKLYIYIYIYFFLVYLFLQRKFPTYMYTCTRNADRLVFEQRFVYGFRDFL